MPQSALEYVPIAIHILDSKFMIIGWNNAASNVFGYASEEVLHKIVLWDCFKYDAPAHQAEIQLKGRGKYEGETLLLRKDGSELYAYLYIVRLPSDDSDKSASQAADDVRGKKQDDSTYACYVTDITQRKYMEGELHEYARELEGKIQQSYYRRATCAGKIRHPASVVYDYAAIQPVEEDDYRSAQKRPVPGAKPGR